MNKTKAGESAARYAGRGPDPMSQQQQEEEEGNKQEGQCNSV